MFCNESELLELDRLKIKNVRGDAIILFLASYFFAFNTRLYQCGDSVLVMLDAFQSGEPGSTPGGGFFLNYASVRKSY